MSSSSQTAPEFSIEFTAIVQAPQNEIDQTVTAEDVDEESNTVAAEALNDSSFNEEGNVPMDELRKASEGAHAKTTLAGYKGLVR